MQKPETFQQQLDVLAYGEVQPLLLATDIERGDALSVHVVLIDPTDDVEPGGHRMTLPVFTRRFPYPDDSLGGGEEQVRALRQETKTAFAERLRELLAEEPSVALLPQERPAPES